MEDDERTLNGLCFSQPVHLDHMLLSTQMQCTPGASQVKENQHNFLLTILVINEEKVTRIKKMITTDKSMKNSLRNFMQKTQCQILWL